MPKYNLPSMPECTGCGACCGPVQASQRDIQKIRKFVDRKKIKWVDHDDPLVCGFYDPDGQRCRIYSVRPFVCQAFGVITEMKCPLFPKAAKQSLPPRETLLRGWSNPVTDDLLASVFAPDGGERMMIALIETLENFADPVQAEKNLPYIQAERMDLVPEGSQVGFQTEAGKRWWKEFKDARPG